MRPCSLANHLRVHELLLSASLEVRCLNEHWGFVAWRDALLGAANLESCLVVALDEGHDLRIEVLLDGLVVDEGLILNRAVMFE
jgi:hypothetical protein